MKRWWGKGKRGAGRAGGGEERGRGKGRGGGEDARQAYHNRAVRALDGADLRPRGGATIRHSSGQLSAAGELRRLGVDLLAELASGHQHEALGASVDGIAIVAAAAAPVRLKALEERLYGREQ